MIIAWKPFLVRMFTKHTGNLDCLQLLKHTINYAAKPPWYTCNHVCLITWHSVAPVVFRGKQKTASKTSTKEVPTLTLKYLFTDPMIKFELRRIWNLHIFDKFHDLWIVIKITLNYTQFENFDNVRFNPPPPSVSIGRQTV